MMAQIIDQDRGTNMAEQIAAGITGQPVAPGATASAPQSTDASTATDGESSTTKNARERVAESTSPT